ncbi:MAG: M1 family metallopeptidase [Clostridia bacterium]|nr:M1 family metallopeptidase [Clostridia bacterium]
MSSVKRVLIKIIILLVIINIFLLVYIGWEYKDRLFLSAHFGGAIDDKAGLSQLLSTSKTEQNEILNLYKGDFDIFPSESRLTGDLQIVFKNRYDISLNQIVLTFYPDWLNPPSKGSYVKKISTDGQDISFKTSEGIIYVSLEQPLQPGQSMILDIKLDINLPEDEGRIGCNKHALWMGNWIPSLAPIRDGEWVYHEFRDIGEPFFTEIAWYEFTVRAPKGYTVAATGQNQGKQKHIYKTKVLARDFALWASKPSFTYSIETKDKKAINLYSYNQLKDNKKVLDAAARALNYMQKRVGDYCYDELDIVETQLHMSGMEYPGMIFIDKDRLADCSTIDTLIAHEVAHQWFYNVVGNDQYSEPWLDEAFATYMADEIIYGESVRDSVSQAIADDKRPITIPIHEFNTETEYRKVIYSKGKYKLHQLKQLLGEKGFSKFLKTYYNEFKFKEVDNEQFFNFIDKIFEKKIGAQARELFSQ